MITVYVPPKASKWSVHNNGKMLNGAVDSVNRTIESSKNVIWIYGKSYLVSLTILFLFLSKLERHGGDR